MTSSIGRRAWLTSILVSLAAAAAAQGLRADAQRDTVAALQRLATERLRREVGTWSTRWVYLDAAGNVASEAEGTEIRSFVIADRVLQTVSSVPTRNESSVSLKFFKTDVAMMYAVSTNPDGDLWTFIEEVDGHVSTSTRHENPDGTATYLRFSTLRETEDEIDVQGDVSTDGVRWTPILRKYAVRRR